MLVPKDNLETTSNKVALLYKLLKLGKGDNSAKYLQNAAKSKSGHLHLGFNLYAKYQDQNSRGSPDILLIRSLMG